MVRDTRAHAGHRSLHLTLGVAIQSIAPRVQELIHAYKRIHQEALRAQGPHYHIANRTGLVLYFGNTESFPYCFLSRLSRKCCPPNVPRLWTHGKCHLQFNTGEGKTILEERWLKIALPFQYRSNGSSLRHIPTTNDLRIRQHDPILHLRTNTHDPYFPRKSHECACVE